MKYSENWTMENFSKKLKKYSDEFWMNIALKNAYKAFKRNEIPVGAVIIYKNEIISEAYNQKETSRNPLAHAELLAIYKASRKLKNWRLKECELFVSLEPCIMCLEAIIQSRIKRLIFGAGESKKTKFKDCKIILLQEINYTSGVMQKECSQLINNAFCSFRKRNKIDKKKKILKPSLIY